MPLGRIWPRALRSVAFARPAALVGLLAAATATAGCATVVVEPGHRGLLFAPLDGGLKRDVLQPGRYKLGFCFVYCTPDHIEDYDVTYATKSEHLDARTSEGLALDVTASITYKPIVSELYALETEIGPEYYKEVIGPEFHSTCSGVFARHSYTELLGPRYESVENEIEAEVRRRTTGKHIEVSGVRLERVAYAPEIAEALRRKIALEEEDARERKEEDVAFARRKRALERELELRRMEQAPACASSAATPLPH
jgi:regulator of protease activity HflC (stomatin/prohibitin superfamily)